MRRSQSFSLITQKEQVCLYHFFPQTGLFGTILLHRQQFNRLCFKMHDCYPLASSCCLPLYLH